MKNQNNFKEKGITLVALIITIIILLILAGVSIMQLTQVELFKNAELAKEKYQKEQMKEEIQMLIMEAQIQENGLLTYENLCQNYLLPNKYIVQNSENFAKITKTANEYTVYINKTTFELTFEKSYETCKVILETDNNIVDFENVIITLKNKDTGNIIQQYKILAEETEHEFIVETGIKYTISVSSLENEIYEYTIPLETAEIDAIANNSRNITMLYKEKVAYLYNNGNFCEVLTGGWDNDFKVNNASPYTKVNPIINSNNIKLSLSNSSGTECIISTINKVDITNYSKVCINYEYDTKPAYSRPLCIFSNKEDFPQSYVAQITNNYCANGISSIDISDIIGSYYIGSGIWNAHASEDVANTRIIYQVWLEK